MTATRTSRTSLLLPWAIWMACMRWMLATALGLALGLAFGAAAVGYGTSLGDSALMGALIGLTLGIAQALVLPLFTPRGVRRKIGGPASTSHSRRSHTTGSRTSPTATTSPPAVGAPASVPGVDSSTRRARSNLIVRG
jgi:hypothetical protein